MDLFTLVARLSMDASDYERGISKSKQSFFSLADSISAKAVAVGTMVAHGVERAASAMIDFGKYAVQASADVEAEIALYKQVFGELESAAGGVLESISQDTNILSTRLRGIGTSAFMQFKGAGVDAGNALAMMDKYTRLAADAAAAYNISIEEADQKLRSFIRGNTEAGDSIYLFTSESQRNERALATYKKKWTELTEAQKQMLMLDVVEEIYTASEVIGQAGRESESWEVIIGNLSGSFELLSATIGGKFKEKISPVVKKLSEFLSDDTVILRLGMLTSSIANVAGKAFDGAINLIDRLIKWSNGEPVEPIRFDFEIPTWEEVSAAVSEKVSAIVEGIKGIANWTLGAFGLPDVDTIVKQVSDWWTGQGENTYERVKSVLKWTFGAFVAPSLNAIDTWWNGEGGGEDSLLGLLCWTLGDFVAPAIADIITTTGGTIAQWAGDFVKGVVAFLDWTLGELNLPTVSDVVNTIQAWWDTVTSNLNLFFGATFEVNKRITSSPDPGTFDAPYTGTGPYDEGWGSDYDTGGETVLSKLFNKSKPEAVGLDYVPYDNFFARLHEGEAVLTKAEAASWRTGGMSVQAPSAQAIGEAVADAMRETLNGLGVYMGADRVGDLVTDRVSRNIAQNARKRRFSPV